MWMFLHENKGYLVKIVMALIGFLSDDWTWGAMILASNYVRLGTSSWRVEFFRSISAMHMAPSASMKLSSNSRWVTVSLDWENTKVDRDTQKIAEKLRKGPVFLVQQTLDISSKPQKALRALGGTVMRGCDRDTAVGIGIQKRCFPEEVLSG